MDRAKSDNFHPRFATCVWALGRLVESQLYGIKPTDPSTIVIATFILCSATLGAALIPARRASAVNPTEALRFE